MRYNVQCHFFGKPEITSAAEHRHQQITNEPLPLNAQGILPTNSQDALS